MTTFKRGDVVRVIEGGGVPTNRIVHVSWRDHVLVRPEYRPASYCFPVKAVAPMNDRPGFVNSEVA